MKIGEILSILKEYDLLIETAGILPEDISGKPETDNRKLSPGDAFVCIKGLSFDGHAFAQDAVQRGAALIVHQDDIAPGLPGIKVTDSRKAAALLAKLYYGDPSSKFSLIGITGTNGKTTTSLIIYNTLRKLGIKAGWIGTLGYYLDDTLFETHNTTPDIMELNGILSRMAQSGAEYVVMEVSSHAIALDRVFGLKFRICMYSNLSRDHLDFHKDMEDYAGTKFGWLDQNRENGVTLVLNTDDLAGCDYYNMYSQSGNVVIGVGRSTGDYILSEMNAEAQRTSFTLRYLDAEYRIESRLIGTFNIQNLALAVTALAQTGIAKKDLEWAISKIEPVKGRFENVPNDLGIGVFIDYAHTPDAIVSILRSCKQLPHKRIICVIGAGGDRDKGKRPLMLSAAVQNSDAVIITDDNPRTENPDTIIQEVLYGSDIWSPWWIIRDRYTAIRSALRLACEGDLVVICGKGHENYQEIEGVRHHFDDYQTAEEVLKLLLGMTKDENELILPVDELQLRYQFNAPNKSSETGYHTSTNYSHIVTDSRKIVPNSVFIALKGERFDGNDFLEDVLIYPDLIAIGSKEINAPHYLKVADGTACIADLCRKYLLMFGVYRIALTGSTGKTSTKEITAQILEGDGKVLKTAHNENNIIGLCQTIFRLESRDKYAVFEIGTNHFGEIARLAEICSPQSAMIINIGPSHLEYLGSEDGVFLEKSTLFDRELEHLLYPVDDPRFEKYSERGRSVGFAPEADYRITDISVSEGSSSFRINSEAYTIPTDIPHYITNSSFAVALAVELGLSPETIRGGLASLPVMGNRLNLQRVNGRTLILDCYNANPVSMQKSIEYWIGIEPESPHIAILGDMLELGGDAPEYHKMIGAILSDHEIDGLITVGDLSQWYRPYYLTTSNHYHTVDDLLARDEINLLPQNAVILLKASHGIHLEQVIPALKGEK